MLKIYIAGIEYLEAQCGCELTDELLSEYDALRERFGTEATTWAIMDLAESYKGKGFPPSVKELGLQIRDALIKASTKELIQKLMSSMRVYGEDWSDSQRQETLDPILNDAIRKYGGWSRCCEDAEDNLELFRSAIQSQIISAIATKWEKERNLVK